jgi:hypothetical protein
VRSSLLDLSIVEPALRCVKAKLNGDSVKQKREQISGEPRF